MAICAASSCFLNSCRENDSYHLCGRPVSVLNHTFSEKVLVQPELPLAWLEAVFPVPVTDCLERLHAVDQDVLFSSF